MFHPKKLKDLTEEEILQLLERLNKWIAEQDAKEKEHGISEDECVELRKARELRIKAIARLP